ncbi:MAG: CocE/NonD family hydrolase [Pseudolabrys sp.]
MRKAGDGVTVIEDGGILIEKDVPIPLSDGHVSYCNVFRPKGAGKVPPIVVFTPYGKDSDVAVDFKRYWDVVLRDHPEVVSDGSTGKYLTWEVPDPERWVPAGYAVVVVDARGTGKSRGFYEMMAPLQTREYFDAIEWAGTQTWSNGKVGLLGVSYLAIKQWQVAALQPPHLAAMIPWEGMFDHYRDFYRHGGIYSSFFLKLLWDNQIATNQNGNAATPYRDRFTGAVSTGVAINPDMLAGNLANVYEAGLKHPFDDAYFRLRTPVAERIRVPFLSAGNWGGLGLHLRGNVEAFERAASRDKWLEMHTDTHFASMYLPDAVALQRRFFDHFLKGEDNGWDRQSRVILTVRDPRGMTRRDENEWPLARTKWTRYYLDADAGALSIGAPASGAAEYDAFGLGVTLRSAPFAADTEFTGPVAAKLFVSSSTADMDLFLTLRVFDPEGGEVTFIGANDPQAPVSQGWLRVSQRKLDPARSRPGKPVHPHDERLPVVPGEVYEVDVEIWPTSIVVPAGYRLALTIAGQDFARPEAQGMMKGSGIFLHDDPADRPADLFGGRNTVHTGGDRASYLLMPLIPPR